MLVSRLLAAAPPFDLLSSGSRISSLLASVISTAPLFPPMSPPTPPSVLLTSPISLFVPPLPLLPSILAFLSLRSLSTFGSRSLRPFASLPPPLSSMRSPSVSLLLPPLPPVCRLLLRPLPLLLTPLTALTPPPLPPSAPRPAPTSSPTIPLPVILYSPLNNSSNLSSVPPVFLLPLPLLPLVFLLVCMQFLLPLALPALPISGRSISSTLNPLLKQSFRTRFPFSSLTRPPASPSTLFPSPPFLINSSTVASSTFSSLFFAPIMSALLLATTPPLSKPPSPP
jgi:hypothetical protein